jgi:hypothetical protein
MHLKYEESHVETETAKDRPQIIEKNIESITLNWFGRQQLLEPVDGEAKWFRDELGYDWVKVRVTSLPEGMQTRVIRSDCVVDVVYRPRALS